jgi:hypothetical protein
MMQILSNPEVAKGFARVVFDLIRQVESSPDVTSP